MTDHLFLSMNVGLSMEERTVDLRLKPRRRYQPLARTKDKTLRWGKGQRAEEKNGSHFDAEYLQRLKDDEPTTWDHFDSYFRSRLTVKLRGRGLSASVIEDAIQDTFVHVLTAVQKDRVRTPDAFGAFVSGVCRNVVLNYWKNVSKSVDVSEIDIPDPAANLEISLLLLERQTLVEEVLNDLRPKDRDLLRAKIFHQLTTEEMSARFGARTPGRLRVMVHRACKKFAKACEKRDVDFFLG